MSTDFMERRIGMQEGDVVVVLSATAPERRVEAGGAQRPSAIAATPSASRDIPATSSRVKRSRKSLRETA
jgi:hypothetical protein